MKCPHCLESFFEKWEEDFLEHDNTDTSWEVYHCICPACGKLIIELGYRGNGMTSYKRRLVNPKGLSRSPIPKEVVSPFSEDYLEACLVLSDSPKASAALSRRCLQSILKEKAHVKKKDLYDQIQEVVDSKTLPSYLSDNLDAVRSIGNIAAHSTKSISTGEIIGVEEGEAEWNLDVIEGLFDFYFVQPEKMKERKEKLNKKLKEAGRPLIK